MGQSSQADAEINVGNHAISGRWVEVVEPLMFPPHGTRCGLR